MRSVAVIGAGISGLAAAYELAKEGVKVVVYEKEDYLGDNDAKTVTVEGVELDLGFMAFNQVKYSNTMELFEHIGMGMEACDMSFSVSLDEGHRYEWGNRNGLSSVFVQKKNALNLYFWKILREIMKFKDDVLVYLEELENKSVRDHTETLGHFIRSRGYSELFQKTYLLPMCCSIWSCSLEQVMRLSAFCVLSYCRNQHLLQLFGRPQWLILRGHSCYVNKVRDELEVRGCQIRTNCEVHSVSTGEEGCTVLYGDGLEDAYDGCVMAINALNALKILGQQATLDEARILGALEYASSDIFLHRDKSFMPQSPAAWSAWNFVGRTENKVCLTCWLNVLQNIGESSQPFFVTFDPPHIPKNTILKWSAGHPIPSVAASNASLELHSIQGNRRIWFCGAHQGFGFHEDGMKAGFLAAQGIVGRSCALLENPKQVLPSFTESVARLLVTRFLRNFIFAGCLILLEDGGTTFTFLGSSKNYSLKVALRVHDPQFYWKVATHADLGFAQAYIDGDFSFVDKNEGLLNFFMIFITNRDSHYYASTHNRKRGWWSPLLFTAGIASAKYFYQHVSRQNTVAQARSNISRHYELSNEMFGIFLGETMAYSSAVFKSDNEDLKTGQLRKMSILIKKARIAKNQELLDIGCGWGTFAIEVVKETGCRYTGITLSQEQLSSAEKRVKEAGLQDYIRFLLCDYRQLPDAKKYDRIVSCEMIEHVGNEYMEDFFHCCDSLLAKDGLLVLQFISMPDERYNAYLQSSEFIKEYIFPGACVPCLSRVITAMAAASRLCVEHLENIGIHYYQTLRCWRTNLMQQQGKILSLGFDEKFIRTWEYYFDYCAAGFRTRTLGDYQIVFSRPGNLSAFSNPYEGIPSACRFE